MTKAITLPALGAASALAGITLKKGWDRMADIDNAKVKLQAIGNSADDVSKIMDNASVAVKGTAYGLNEAATTAASAVAAGIKPGQELEKYLSSVSDAAAVAGVDMESMGSIFNKVATQSKASNEVLQQMSEAGIPVYQYLSEQLGVTASDVFDMASAGEIGLEQFQSAVESHIGGAAKTIGSSTITGAISNLKASISRIGANFLGSADDADSFAGRMLPLLNDMMGGLGGIEEKAKEWGSVFGEVFGGIIDYCKTGKVNISSLSDTAGGIVEKVTPIIDTVKKVADAFMGLSPEMQKSLLVGAVAGGPVLSAFGKISTTIGGTIDGLGMLGGGFIKIGGKAKDILGGVSETAGKMTGGFSKIGGELGKLMPTGLAEGFTKLISPVSQAAKTVKAVPDELQNMLGVTAKLHPKLGGLATGMGKFLTPGLKVAGLVVKFAKFASVLGLIAGAAVLVYKNFDKIKAWAEKMGEKVKSALDKSGNGISSIKEKFSDVIAKVGPLVEKFKEMFDKVKIAAQPLLDFLQSVFEAGIVSTFEAVGKTVSDVIDNISGIIDGLMEVFDGVIDVLAGDFTGGWSKIWNGLKDIVGNAFGGLVNLVRTPINAVIGLINKAIDKVNSIGFNVPEWAQKLAGTDRVAFNLPNIPLLYKGTDNWKGGQAIINEPQYGGEIVDLPKGTRVYPHDESVRMARESGGKQLNITIPKLADQIIVREDSDIDKVIKQLVNELIKVIPDMA